MEKTPVKEVEVENKLAVIVDLDGVLLNYDDENGYKKHVEDEILNSSSILGILNQNNPQKVEQISEETKETIKQALWEAWDEARAERGSPNERLTAAEFGINLENERLLSEEKSGTFKKGDPWFDSIKLDIELTNHRESHSEEEIKKLILEHRKAVARYQLVTAVQLAFFSKELKSTLYPGANDALTNLGKLGRVVIWTEGNTPEQTSKILNSGLYPILEDLHPSIELYRKKGAFFDARWQNILRTPSHFISEDKQNDIPEMLEHLQKEGYSKFVVVEDKAQNLAAFLDQATELGLKDKVIPIWVRQGRHKNTTPESMSLEETAELYNAVDSISQVSEKINQLWLSSSA